MSDSIEPFHLSVPEDALDDLRERLRRTRWPDPAPVADNSQGVRLERMQALVEYWRDGYDWRRCEAMLNGLGQHRTVIDGVGIHFLQVRSPEPDALPLLLTHGWPGSVLEFAKMVGPLTDPVAHGGSAGDAFHLVVPSLPGFAFSDKPRETGWGVKRVAAAWIALMERLGHARWVAQGGDWGGGITAAIGGAARAGCAGIHLNYVMYTPDKAEIENATPEEKRILDVSRRYQEVLSGYMRQQTTRPQGIGYSLDDSPVGLAAWIYERFQDWSDSGGDAERVFTRDEILDDVMLYWLTRSGASSARMYWESQSFRTDPGIWPVRVPTSISMFPHEINRISRRWAERRFSDLVNFRELDAGGHFAALEQPELLTREIRDAFRHLRR